METSERVRGKRESVKPGASPIKNAPTKLLFRAYAQLKRIYLRNWRNRETWASCCNFLPSEDLAIANALIKMGEELRLRGYSDPSDLWSL